VIKRCSLMLLVCCAVAPQSARAQGWPDATVPAPLAAIAGNLPAKYSAGGGTMPTLTPAGDPRLARGSVVDLAKAVEISRPKALVPLYASMSALQGLDAVSTWRALGSGGGREANPLMAPVVSSPSSMVALKAGVAGSMIFASERMWKTNRKAAVLLLIGTNVGYAAVVSHNFAVSRR
jgi:hypothetical protein